MEKVDYQEPYPDWTEVIIWWAEIMYGPRYPIKQILEWLDTTPGGKYHLHGHKQTEGFAIRFECPEDATLFRLRWL